jgi:hypothetical protein
MYRLALIAVLLPSLFCLGQQAPDPTAILQQAKQRLLNDVARMPRLILTAGACLSARCWPRRAPWDYTSWVRR